MVAKNSCYFVGRDIRWNWSARCRFRMCRRWPPDFDPQLLPDSIGCCPSVLSVNTSKEFTMWIKKDSVHFKIPSTRNNDYLETKLLYQKCECIDQSYQVD